MPSEASPKKIMEKLNRAQKCSILGPQNLRSRGGPGPRGPPGSAPEIIWLVAQIHGFRLLMVERTRASFKNRVAGFLSVTLNRLVRPVAPSQGQLTVSLQATLRKYTPILFV